MSRDRAPLKSRINADRKVVETVEELIAIYKREFGDDWKNIFSQVVSVKIEGRS